ncbi:MAG: hypothetical protein HXX20_11840 [Chloroflexi bacterium]|nr:hypothetical protein [Chloroflexota bacterium]
MAKISAEEFREAMNRLVKERDSFFNRGELKEARRLSTLRTPLQEWFDSGQVGGFEGLSAEVREMLASFLGRSLESNPTPPVPSVGGSTPVGETASYVDKGSSRVVGKEEPRTSAGRSADREELKIKETERQRLFDVQRLADNARQTSDLLTAIKLWEEVIEKDPANFNYQLELDRVRDNLKREISGLLTQGEQAFKAENYNEAQRAYNRAENLSSDPGEQQVIRERLSLIAQEQAKSSRLIDATQIIREIEKAIREKQAPSHLLKLIGRGQELIDSGRGNPVLEKKVEEAEKYRYELIELSGGAATLAASNDLKGALVKLQTLITAGHRYFDDGSGEQDIILVKKEYETRYREFCDLKLEEYIMRAEESLPKYPQKAVTQLQQGLELFDQANTATEWRAKKMLEDAKDKGKRWEEADKLIQEVRNTQPPILEKLKQYRRARDIYAGHPDIDQLLALSEQESDSYLLDLAQGRLTLLRAKGDERVTLNLEMITQLQEEIQAAREETLGQLSQAGRQKPEYRKLDNAYTEFIGSLSQRETRRRNTNKQLGLFEAAMQQSNYSAAAQALDAIGPEDRANTEVQTASSRLDGQRSAQEIFNLAQENLKAGMYELAIDRFNEYKVKGGNNTLADRGIKEVIELAAMADIERLIQTNRYADAKEDLLSVIAMNGTQKQKALEKLREVEERLIRQGEIKQEFDQLKLNYDRYSNYELLDRMISILGIHTNLQRLAKDPSDLQKTLLEKKREIEQEIRAGFDQVYKHLQELAEQEDNPSPTKANQSGGLTGRYEQISQFIQKVETQMGGLQGAIEIRAKTLANVRLLMSEARDTANLDERIGKYNLALAEDKNYPRLRERLARAKADKELKRIRDEGADQSRRIERLRELLKQDEYAKNLYLLVEIIQAFEQDSELHEDAFTFIKDAEDIFANPDHGFLNERDRERLKGQVDKARARLTLRRVKQTCIRKVNENLKANRPWDALEAVALLWEDDALKDQEITEFTIEESKKIVQTHYNQLLKSRVYSEVADFMLKLLGVFEPDGSRPDGSRRHILTKPICETLQDNLIRQMVDLANELGSTSSAITEQLQIYSAILRIKPNDSSAIEGLRVLRNILSGLEPEPKGMVERLQERLETFSSHIQRGSNQLLNYQQALEECNLLQRATEDCKQLATNFEKYAPTSDLSRIRNEINDSSIKLDDISRDLAKINKGLEAFNRDLGNLFKELTLEYDEINEADLESELEQLFRQVNPASLTSSAIQVSDIGEANTRLGNAKQYRRGLEQNFRKIRQAQRQEKFDSLETREEVTLACSDLERLERRFQRLFKDQEARINQLEATALEVTIGFTDHRGTRVDKQLNTRGDHKKEYDAKLQNYLDLLEKKNQAEANLRKFRSNVETDQRANDGAIFREYEKVLERRLGIGRRRYETGLANSIAQLEEAINKYLEIENSPALSLKAVDLARSARGARTKAEHDLEELERLQRAVNEFKANADKWWDEANDLINNLWNKRAVGKETCDRIRYLIERFGEFDPCGGYKELIERYNPVSDRCKTYGVNVKSYECKEQ